MVRFAVAVAVGLIAALPASAARMGLPPGTAAVIASNTHAGAKPVALTYTLTYEMQCGDPGRTPLTLGLPAGMTVPSSIPAADVVLNGAPAKSVRTSGSTLVITIEHKGSITCDVIGMGTVKIVIAKRAGLGNPKQAGIYSFPVSIGSMQGTPKLRITA